MIKLKSKPKKNDGPICSFQTLTFVTTIKNRISVNSIFFHILQLHVPVQLIYCDLAWIANSRTSRDHHVKPRL